MVEYLSSSPELYMEIVEMENSGYKLKGLYVEKQNVMQFMMTRSMYDFRVNYSIL